MRMIFNIAKAELRNLFFSPVAWLLLIVFLAQCGWFYTNELYTNANWQDILLKNNPDFKRWDHVGFTRILLLTVDGLFINILQNIYLFIPLLTMGIIGKEKQNGTFRLLYSVPVRLSQIVAGKFLSIMIFNLLLVLITGVFMITAAFNMESPDYGMMFSAALGFYLLACTYAAIGIFMSSLTTYQIIAALSTFLTIYLLTSMSAFGQQYDFIRDLTWFLDLYGRAERMLVGLITTKDVFYFLIISFLFLAFTWLKLKGSRENKPFYLKAMGYGTVLVVALLLGYVSSRPILTGYWDTTAQQLNTIHEKTQKIMREMSTEPLEVTLYTNLMEADMGVGLPQNRNNYLFKVWEKYLRFKPAIKFNYVYYFDHDSTILGKELYNFFPGKKLDYIAKKIAGFSDIDLSSWLNPVEIKEQFDARSENLRLVMALKYKGRTEYLRTYPKQDLWPEEYHIAAALKRLVYPDYPRVAFITDHFERNIYKKGEREYSKHTANKLEYRALINLGFDTDTIALDREDIPENITTLVLADPKSALSPLAQQKIKHYLDKGGNMFIFGEHGKQQILNPVLQQLGLQLMDGILAGTNYLGMDFVNTYYTNAGLSMVSDPTSADFKKVADRKEHVMMESVAGIEQINNVGFAVHPIMKAPEENTWLKKGPLVVDSASVQFNASEGDRKGSFPIAIALTRKINGREQRIIVSGDADFMANKNEVIHRIGIRYYSWLNNGEYPVVGAAPDPKDTLLTITGKTAAMLKIVYVWILPGALLLIGSIILIRRKRK